MAIPIIIGAAALVAASYGAKKGYDGYQKHSEANDIVKSSKESYEAGKIQFEDQEKITQSYLSKLGKLELDIGKGFNDFKMIADKLLAQLNANTTNQKQIQIPQHQLQKIEDYSYTALGVLGSVAGAGLAGAAAGFAVYGGVMTLGAASTGTAISSLSGIAATNATLAAIGGGSLASGGLGIAGGTAILSAAVAGPVLAIAGWAYDSHGESSVRNAEKIRREVEQVLVKLERAKGLLIDVEGYSDRIRTTLASIYNQFDRYYLDLVKVDSCITDLKARGLDAEAELRKLGDTIIEKVGNGYALAAILTDIILTPIFKPEIQAGSVILDENDTPKMELDDDGLMILNSGAINAVLDDATKQAVHY